MTMITASAGLSYGPDPRQQLDVLVPTNQGRGDPPPLLLALHAGWWVRGSRSDLLPVSWELCQRGMAVAPVDFRLLQGSRTGADLIADVVAAAKVALEEYQVLGGGDQVVIVGSGAGGLLGMCALSQLQQALPGVLSGVAMVGTAPGLQPWDSCPVEVQGALQHFRGTGVDDPLQNPDDSLPPVLLLHGDQDDEVPCALARGVHAALVDHDVSSTLAIIAGAGHRFLEDPSSQAGRSACTRLLDWLGRLPQLRSAGADGPVVAEPTWLSRP